VHIEENIPLAPFTTLRIGGPARYLVRIDNEAELVEAVEFARQQALPVFVLGGGSNLVVGDGGFDGVVLHMAIGGAGGIEEDGATVTFNVSAGMGWDAFVFEVCERGLSGIECLAGIPGLVGGTPVQNVGAYGQEVAETIVSVRALDLEAMQFVSMSAAECGFGYRRSIFNSTARGRYIVTAVTFRFERGREVELKYAELQRHFAGRQPTPLEVYEAVRAIRHGKGMLLVEGEPDCRSAGSFFKNPVVDADVFARVVSGLGVSAEGVPHWPADEGQVKLAAAWLVEKAGFHKGFAMGRAGISSRHTLALVNRGEATAGEILALRDEVRRRVKERFGIELEQEPVMLGVQAMSGPLRPSERTATASADADSLRE
jgi:UDP-N-acetylmuramate dehydrogenase